MRDKLEILNNRNKVKYKYILFDKWFASINIYRRKSKKEVYMSNKEKQKSGFK